MGEQFDLTNLLRCCLLVCSAITVEYCVLYPCLVIMLLCKKEGSSPVLLQLLRGGIWACINAFHMGGIMLLLRAVLNIRVRNVSPRGLRCMILSLSGPCDL